MSGPENPSEPKDPFASPEEAARLAYEELIASLELWKREHPSVTPDDVDILRFKLNKAIEDRDKHMPPGDQG